MKTIFLTAYRSLIGNGLKTWLNVSVLSVSFVLIIFMQGLLEGWSRQAVTDAIAWEVGGGQLRSEAYDPYDPFTLDSAAQPIPQYIAQLVREQKAAAILITQASIYPNGRMQNIMLKGIAHEQNILQLPTQHLKPLQSTIPVIIGTHMAKQTHLAQGDVLTLRWRNQYGAFEATDIMIAAIFQTTVPTVDNGQMWIDLSTLQNMTQRFDQATLAVVARDIIPVAMDKWRFENTYELTKQTLAMVEAKSGGMAIFYAIFLMLALISIFDTQTLSIFRRQREIGTLVALGMTQKRVQMLFTLEGTMNALLAIALGCVYGVPLFIYFANNGIALPMDVSDFGLPIGDKMYPLFTAKLIASTVVFIITITAIVSYIPARKIAKMNPTEAIRKRG